MTRPLSNDLRERVVAAEGDLGDLPGDRHTFGRAVARVDPVGEPASGRLAGHRLDGLAADDADADARADCVAKALSAGKVVGFFSGRMNGP